MLTKRNEKDGDDSVNIEDFQGRTEVDFEETNPMNIQTNISKKDTVPSDTIKNIEQLGHSEENKRDELERENSFLSKKSQKKKILMI